MMTLNYEQMCSLLDNSVTTNEILVREPISIMSVNFNFFYKKSKGRAVEAFGNKCQAPILTRTSKCETIPVVTSVSWSCCLC